MPKEIPQYIEELRPVTRRTAVWLDTLAAGDKLVFRRGQTCHLGTSRGFFVKHGVQPWRRRLIRRNPLWWSDLEHQAYCDGSVTPVKMILVRYPRNTVRARRLSSELRKLCLKQGLNPGGLFRGIWSTLTCISAQDWARMERPKFEWRNTRFVPVVSAQKQRHDTSSVQTM